MRADKKAVEIFEGDCIIQMIAAQGAAVRKVFRQGVAMKTVIITALLSIACGSAFADGQTPDVVEKMGLKYATVEGATIYYEPCLEAKLGILKKAYTDYRMSMAGNKEIQTSDPELASKKTAMVDDIYTLVGGDSAELKAKLLDVADHFIGSSPTLSLPLVGAGNIIYLMLQSTTKDYLRAGGTLPNLAYDRETDRAEYKLFFGAGTDNASNQELLVPVKSVDEVETVVSQIFALLPQQLKTSLNEASRFIAIHEIAEAAIVGRMRSGDPFKRWFTDGFANAVTYEILRRHYSQQDADTFLKGYSTEPYQQIRNQINLQYWMSAQLTFVNKWPIEKEEKCNYARYCYATEEARRIVNEHGIDSVKKILDIYIANGEKKPGAILTAIQQATSDDIQNHLMQYQSFKTKEEGLKQYQHAYEAAIAGKDVQGMIFNMLRMVDLRGEQPFDASSLELRNNIATLLYMAGEKTLATQSITEFADYLCQSENPHNRYVGQNFVIIYAMRVGQPEIALGYAQKTLKDKPDDVYALTIMMQIAKQELDFEKARELAQKICDLEPVEEGPCYQMAKKILSSEDEASGKH
jgi:hypothetical protein